MPTLVTDLMINQIPEDGHPDCFALNIVSDNASTAREILAAAEGKRHWIECVTLTVHSIGENSGWFRLLDGNNILIGPILLADGVPWKMCFSKALCSTAGNALNIKTETDFGVHLIIEGRTDP